MPSYMRGVALLEIKPLASIQKIAYVNYVDRNGKRVPKGTKGARKVTTESSKYYACWRDGKKQVRVPLATDFQASQVMLADLIRKRERGEANLIDPHKEYLDSPLVEQINEYLAVVRSTTRSEDHQKETARILNLFVKDGGCARLRDVTPYGRRRDNLGKTGSIFHGGPVIHHSTPQFLAYYPGYVSHNICEICFQIPNLQKHVLYAALGPKDQLQSV